MSQGISQKCLKFLGAQFEAISAICSIYTKPPGISMNKMYLLIPLHLDTCILATSSSCMIQFKHHLLGEDFPFSVHLSYQTECQGFFFRFSNIYWAITMSQAVYLHMLLNPLVIICVPSRMWTRGGDCVLHLCLQCLTKCSAYKVLTKLPNKWIYKSLPLSYAPFWLTASVSYWPERTTNIFFLSGKNTDKVWTMVLMAPYYRNISI